MKANNQRQKSKSSPTWPPILERKYPSGQVGYQIAVMVNGSRVRQSFKTIEAAEIFAVKIRQMKAVEGSRSFDLTASDRIEATKCVELLKPYDVPLSEAVAHYIKHVLAYRNAPKVSEIVEKMIAEAQKNDRRPATVSDLKHRLGGFAQTFGERQASSISIEELKHWLDAPALSARSRINNATKLSQLFNYAIAHGWAQTNIVERIQRPSTEDAEVEIFTVEETARLLEHADDFGLLPYIAIGLFAGLRASELQRLGWSAVRLSERSIVVGSGVAKKRSRRVVEINDTLAGWLALCKARSPIMPTKRPEQLYDKIGELATAAKVKWKGNGLRHSFGSYHLALHGDAVKTAFQMGNSPEIVHNHYKGLVVNGDVERYWKLKPSKAEGKITVFKSAAA